MPDGASLRGFARIADLSVATTGALGASQINGDLRPRAFPTWSTIPSLRNLGAGRRWHFFFAWFFVLNGLIYLVYGFSRGHFRQDLLPSSEQLTPKRKGLI